MQLALDLDAYGQSERSLLDRRIHAASELSGNDLETSPSNALTLDELHDRMLDRLGGAVASSYLPNARRLATLLREHIDAGEVEIVGGSYRLTRLGDERYGGLLDPEPATILEHADKFHVRTISRGEAWAPGVETNRVDVPRLRDVPAQRADRRRWESWRLTTAAGDCAGSHLREGLTLLPRGRVPRAFLGQWAGRGAAGHLAEIARTNRVIAARGFRRELDEALMPSSSVLEAQDPCLLRASRDVAQFRP